MLTTYTYVVGRLLVSNISLTVLLYLFYVGSYGLSTEALKMPIFRLF